MAAMAPRRRRLPFKTTAGAGKVTSLLMPSLQLCHLNRDMDRRHPLLETSQPHRKPNVSLKSLKSVPVVWVPQGDGVQEEGERDGEARSARALPQCLPDSGVRGFGRSLSLWNPLRKRASL